MVKAENEQLKAAKAKQDARDGVRAYGDGLRWPTVAGGMAIKYTVPRHGPVYNAILIAWASLWIVIFDWFHYFQAWNREG